MRYRGIITVIFIVLTLSACAPSESAVSTAIAHTLEAKPSETLSPIPVSTQTPSPTSTNTPEPTFTLSPTPDIRVYDIDPRALLLERDDLPQDCRYYLPASDWISPHRNSEILSGMGVEEGREYLDKTQRIDGWVVSYARGTRTVIAPEVIYNNVILYETSEGAMTFFNDFANCQDETTGYAVVDTEFQIGDESISCIHREMQPSGEYWVYYLIEFVQRNIVHRVTGYGWESEVEAEFVEEVASIIYKKFEGLPLSQEVRFRP